MTLGLPPHPTKNGQMEMSFGKYDLISQRADICHMSSILYHCAKGQVTIKQHSKADR